jgi:hypothetical protein
MLCLLRRRKTMLGLRLTESAPELVDLQLSESCSPQTPSKIPPWPPHSGLAR